MRMESNGGSFTEWFDFAFVRKRVTKCDDIRGAAEVFNKTYHSAKGNLGEPINGELAVVELHVRNSLQVDLTQLLHLFHLNANGDRRYLLVVANDDRLVSKVESEHCSGVALACFVNDDNIKPGCARVKSL